MVKKEYIKNSILIMATLEPPQNKTWDLSLYELNRTAQESINDNTEIAVSPRSLHSELMCPICLDMLKRTMTTKECLHRFCSDCIVTALRSGNKECPTCRKKLVSKRSLRADPNFDYLISKIYPNRDEYEAHQERVLAKFNKSHSQVALVNSINEGIKSQHQNRPQRSRKYNENEDRYENTNSQSSSMNNTNGGGLSGGSAGTATEMVGIKDGSMVTGISNGVASGAGGSENGSVHRISNPPSIRSTPSPVPSNLSGGTAGKKIKRSRSILTSERSEESESNSEIDYSRTEGNDSNVDTENEANSELGNDEIELVFKPHPTEMSADNPLLRALKENCIRYLKTTANASVDHLSKYLAMRLTLDLQTELPETDRLINFCIYIAPQPTQILVLNGNQTLQQVNEKFWKVNKPMEMFYSWKKP